MNMRQFHMWFLSVTVQKRHSFNIIMKKKHTIVRKMEKKKSMIKCELMHIKIDTMLTVSRLVFIYLRLSSSLCPFRHNNQMLYAFHCVCMYNGKMIRFLR